MSNSVYIIMFEDEYQPFIDEQVAKGNYEQVANFKAIRSTRPFPGDGRYLVTVKLNAKTTEKAQAILEEVGIKHFIFLKKDWIRYKEINYDSIPQGIKNKILNYNTWITESQLRKVFRTFEILDG